MGETIAPRGGVWEGLRADPHGGPGGAQIIPFCYEQTDFRELHRPQYCVTQNCYTLPPCWAPEHLLSRCLRVQCPSSPLPTSPREKLCLSWATGLGAS